MSKLQVSKPCAVKKSIAPGRPGTCKSNVGCEAMDETCTNRIVPAFFVAGTAGFSHRNSRASPFLVQCSCPCTAVADSGLFIMHSLVTDYFVDSCADPRKTLQCAASTSIATGSLSSKTCCG